MWISHAQPQEFFVIRDGASLITTGSKLTYTVPAGRTAVIDSIIVRLTTVTGYSGVPSLRVGVTPNFNEMLSATALTDMDAVNDFIDLVRLGGEVKHAFSGGEVITVDCSTASQSTALLATIELRGHLI